MRFIHEIKEIQQNTSYKNTLFILKSLMENQTFASKTFSLKVANYQVDFDNWLIMHGYSDEPPRFTAMYLLKKSLNKDMVQSANQFREDVKRLHYLVSELKNCSHMTINGFTNRYRYLLSMLLVVDLDKLVVIFKDIEQSGDYWKPLPFTNFVFTKRYNSPLVWSMGERLLGYLEYPINDKPSVINNNISKIISKICVLEHTLLE